MTTKTRQINSEPNGKMLNMERDQMLFIETISGKKLQRAFTCTLNDIDANRCLLFVLGSAWVFIFSLDAPVRIFPVNDHDEGVRFCAFETTQKAYRFWAEYQIVYIGIVSINFVRLFLADIFVFKVMQYVLERRFITLFQNYENVWNTALRQFRIYSFGWFNFKFHM